MILHQVNGQVDTKVIVNSCMEQLDANTDGKITKRKIKSLNLNILIIICDLDEFVSGLMKSFALRYTSFLSIKPA